MVEKKKENGSEPSGSHNGVDAKEDAPPHTARICGVNNTVICALAVIAVSVLFEANNGPPQCPMCEAAFRADLGTLQELIGTRGAANTEADRFGNRPLHWACKAASLKTIKMLVTRSNAEMKAANNAGTPALHWACTKSPRSVIEYLLENGADITQKNQAGETALHWAVHWINEEAVAAILKHDEAKIHEVISMQDENGNTALHNISPGCATDPACQRIVANFMKHNADLTTKNNFGRTPLAHFDYAAATETLKSDAKKSTS
mmetsp:Transcript_10078/g.16289  ORF Transcript_10078/g.16289 Transcript_10078/m.16289 type:complete len:262 (+) Transcript_10078:102-887(+)